MLTQQLILQRLSGLCPDYGQTFPNPVTEVLSNSGAIFAWQLEGKRPCDHFFRKRVRRPLTSGPPSRKRFSWPCDGTANRNNRIARDCFTA
jgi:hypothetical protein